MVHAADFSRFLLMLDEQGLFLLSLTRMMRPSLTEEAGFQISGLFAAWHRLGAMGRQGIWRRVLIATEPEVMVPRLRKVRSHKMVRLLLAGHLIGVIWCWRI